jgi:ribonucleoside-diphosphate reductase alpha chain
MQVPVENTKMLHIHPLFSKNVHPFDTIKWIRRDAVIVGSDGKEKFRQNNVEVPEWWNETTVNVVAEKYFRVVNGTKEVSAKQMFDRVAKWIATNSVKQGLLNETNSWVLYHELLYMFSHGMHAFNSPVWFNVGVLKEAQCSACFIQAIEDNMSSILDLAQKEVMLFKGGSGTGSNLSPLRSSWEFLSGGGRPSGPVSFMKFYDKGAGVTKSGGTTRRAAKMVVLDVDHPDILEQRNGEAGFITCKAVAEKLAQDLYSTGQYTAEWNIPGNIYDLVDYQNANNSVRVSHAFMQAVEDGGIHHTREVKTGDVVHEYDARMLMEKISDSAWVCGDPGLQFDTTINDWHTCPKSGRITASNPCSEYLFLDDTSCNLSSLNVLKFAKGGRQFDLVGFGHACELAIIAKEVIVGASSYPSKKLEEMSHRFRTLGLGYTNLGALLTFWGLPYDSNEGRDVAAAITSIMCATAYRMSAKMASVQGPFDGYEANSEEMLRVIRKHGDAAKRLPTPINKEWQVLVDASIDLWADAYRLGTQYGYRNAQVTVIAPTGTISFLMGADTTGAEPMLGCVVYKKIVGEGTLVLANGVIEPALRNLGYTEETIAPILEHIREKRTIHGAPGFDSKKHGPIFAEALGEHSLRPEAHVDMLIAIQPFVSGSISKTVNMPHEATSRDIYEIYMRAWRGGLKCIAVYRDGCKLSQPIATKLTDASRSRKELLWGQRKKLPSTRDSLTHKFSVNQQEGYITAGIFEDGTLGEVFVRVSKAGSTLQGIIDAWAIGVSMAIQYGAPFDTIRDKFVDMQFEPRGFTDNNEIRMAKSIPDYVFRWLELIFFGQKAHDVPSGSVITAIKEPASPGFDGPPCGRCGNLTKRSGSCYVCTQCGTTTGCS